MGSSSLSEECSSVDLGDFGYCTLVAMVLVLGVDSRSSCLVVAKVVEAAAEAAARSSRCMEVVGHVGLVGVGPNCVSR